MAFTDSQLKEVQVKIQEVFLGEGRTALQNKTMPKTALRLFEEQTATVNALYSNQTCIGHEVLYLLQDSTTLPTVSTTGADDACDIPAGDTISSAKKEYNPNIYITKVIELDDNFCDNNYQFNEVLAKHLVDNMHLIARALNNKIIGDLTAFAQTPANAGEKGTIVGNTITFNAADFDADLLADWRQIATLEDLNESYLILNGQNFYNAYYNDQFNAANDDGRADILKFNAGEKMSWDLKSFVELTKQASSFLVDPNMYAFFSRNKYTEDLREVGDKDNTKLFSLPLQYVDYDAQGNPIVRTMQFNNGGQMQDIMIDVRYIIECTTGGDGGRVQYKHKWELKLEGMFDIAPATSGSGILEMVKV